MVHIPRGISDYCCGKLRLPVVHRHSYFQYWIFVARRKGVCRVESGGFSEWILSLDGVGDYRFREPSLVSCCTSLFLVSRWDALLHIAAEFAVRVNVGGREFCCTSSGWSRSVGKLGYLLSPKCKFCCTSRGGRKGAFPGFPTHFLVPRISVVARRLVFAVFVDIADLLLQITGGAGRRRFRTS
jgi:hypothetical protein